VRWNDHFITAIELAKLGSKLKARGGTVNGKRVIDICKTAKFFLEIT
jgi:hypothetical protein